MAFRWIALIVLLGCANAKTRFVDQYYTCEMGFFVSSTQVSDSISIANADAQCVALSAKVGDCNKRPWKAYLSSASGNARDRIGNGPWYNVKGQLLAGSLQNLYATAPSPALFRTELDQDASAVQVMTGSNTQGTLSNSCDTGGNMSFGYTATVSQWSDVGSPSPCGNVWRMYCFASD